jgi:hypothetical protein
VISINGTYIYIYCTGTRMGFVPFLSSLACPLIQSLIPVILKSGYTLESPGKTDAQALYYLLLCNKSPSSLCSLNTPKLTWLKKHTNIISQFL